MFSICFETECSFSGRRLYMQLCYGTFYMCEAGSSVGIANGYGLDSPGPNPGGNEIFHPSRPELRPTQTPVQWLPGLSRGVKCGHRACC